MRNNKQKPKVTAQVKSKFIRKFYHLHDRCFIRILSYTCLPTYYMYTITTYTKINAYKIYVSLLYTIRQSRSKTDLNKKQLSKLVSLTKSNIKLTYLVNQIRWKKNCVRAFSIYKRYSIEWYIARNLLGSKWTDISRLLGSKRSIS